MKKKLLVCICLFLSLQLSAQPESWSARGVGGGGALFSPSINPADHNEFFIACDMSELFHSVDFGKSYNQVHFSQFMGGANSKVNFTVTPGLLYSISYVNDLGTPVKSSDGGITWQVLSGNPEPDENFVSLHANYEKPNQLLISTYGSIYFSANGGTDFTLIHTAVNSGAGNVVGGVLFSDDTILIGTNDGVLISEDAGTSWNTLSLTGMPANERIWSFTAGRVGATIRMYCLAADVADVYVGVTGSDYYSFCKGIYTCDLGLSQWTSITNGIDLSEDFPMFIDMAENDINTVYIAGSDDRGVPTIFKTPNSGSNWVSTFLTQHNLNISTGWSGDGGDRNWTYGECPFGIDVATNDANVVIFGDYGFCHKTSDGGTSWKQAYVNPSGEHPVNMLTPQKQNYRSAGIENTSCWQIHWCDEQQMWAGYSDIRGCRSEDGGESWSFNYTGNDANTTYRIVESTDGTLYAATSNIHDMYQSTRLTDVRLDANDANGKIIYSSDCGGSWQNLKLFNHPVFWIALDPNNPNRAYASVIHYAGGTGIGGVYRCDDLNSLASSTWTLLADPPRTEKHPATLVVLNDGKLLATFSGRRNTAGNFTPSSGVFIYDPSSNAWTDVSAPEMHYWTKDVVLDPNDTNQNTWYAGVFSGWGGAPNGLGGLFRTSNRGQTWTKLTGSTLDRVTSCTFNPLNKDELYLTTETQGLWLSKDIQSALPTFTVVDSYPFRQPERVFFNPFRDHEMWVTSFGNGIKVGTEGPSGHTAFEVTSKKIMQVSPNPSDGNIEVVISGNLLSESPTIEVTDMSGKLITSMPVKADVTKLHLQGLANGIYLLKLKSNQSLREVQKIVITK